MAGSPFKIALAQISVPDQLDAALDLAAGQIAQAAASGAQLIAFTELSLTPFFPQFSGERKHFEAAESFPDGRTLSAITRLATANKIDIVINFFEHAGGAKFYDTCAICRDDGSILGPVRMAHPAEEPGFNEKYYYWPGDTAPAVYDLGYTQMGIAICYDRHFPEYTRALVLQGAELVISPFAGTVNDPIDAYLTEMQAFSFQNQVYSACVNRCGDEPNLSFAGASFVTGPNGNVIASAGSGPELLIAEIDPQSIINTRTKRPFLRDRRPHFYKEWS